MWFEMFYQIFFVILPVVTAIWGCLSANGFTLKVQWQLGQKTPDLAEPNNNAVVTDEIENKWKHL